MLLSIVTLNPNFSLLYTIVGLVVILLLLTISALASGSEAAYFSLTPGDLNALKQKKAKSSDLVLKLLDKPDHLISAILLTNNIVNVATVTLATFLTASIFTFSADIYKFIFEVVIITFLLLLFGEITPKIFATYNAPRFATFISRPLYFATIILRPLSFLMVGVSSRMNKKISKSKKSELSIDDLSSALNVTKTSSSEDRKILKGIVNFGNTDVREIMTPRIDVNAIDIFTNYKELRERIVQWEYSRLPVYEDNLDDIKGILYIKDLLKYLDESDDFIWQPLIRPAFFVPENKKINDLLEEFQDSKNHIAIVVDEYGGTFGIVTLEDILEEIVGEISDESDQDKLPYIKQSDGTYLFEGKTMLIDFCKIMNISDDYFDDISGEAETLAGLMLEIKGDFPNSDEDIKCQRFTFRVAAFEGRRIQRIRVTDEESVNSNTKKGKKDKTLKNK
jgi:gliding motility-associated protein GldE